MLLAWVDAAVCLVALYSRMLSDAERNFSGMDCKMLEVVDSLHHFYHCLLGYEFRVTTDSVLFQFKLLVVSPLNTISSNVE